MDNFCPDKMGFKATFRRVLSIGAVSALRIDYAFAIDDFQIG